MGSWGIASWPQKKHQKIRRFVWNIGMLDMNVIQYSKSAHL